MASAASPPVNRMLALLVGGGGVMAFVVLVAVLAAPENPDTKSCYETATEYDEDVQFDPKLREMRHLAYHFEACHDACMEENDGTSCFTVARVYAGGKGLLYEGGVDLTKAEEFAQRGCELRGDALCRSADRYRCLQDESACELRCERGQGYDCVVLADAVDRFGTDGFDPSRAAQLHGLACRGGEEESCAKERRLRCVGDPEACAQRCKQDEAPVCFELGEILERGIGGITKDPAKALEFKRRGCELDVSVNARCKTINRDAKLSL